MMPEWNHLDSSSTMSEQQESVKKKTLKSSSRSFLFSTGLIVIVSMSINSILSIIIKLILLIIFCNDDRDQML